MTADLIAFESYWYFIQGYAKFELVALFHVWMLLVRLLTLLIDEFNHLILTFPLRGVLRDTD